MTAGAIIHEYIITKKIIVYFIDFKNVKTSQLALNVQFTSIGSWQSFPKCRSRWVLLKNLKKKKTSSKYSNFDVYKVTMTVIKKKVS